MISAQRAFYILISLLLCQILQAQQSNLPPVYNIVSDTATDQELGVDNYQILEDKDGNWSIEEVSKLPVSNKFHFNEIKQKEIKGIYWIRYHLKNIMNHPANIVLQTNSEYNDFYLFPNNGNPAHLVTGFLAPWEKKAGFKGNNSLPVNMKPGEELVIYERIKQVVSPIPLIIKIGNTEKVIKRDYVGYVESRTDYFGSIHLQEMFLEGLLFIVIFYNLAFFWLTKEREYLYFSLFILFLAIARLVNTVGVYLYWNYPPFLPYLGYLNLSFAFISIFLILFIRTYFKTFVFYKGWDRFLIILSIVAAASDIVFVLIDPSAFFDNSTSPLLKLLWSILFSSICFAVIITFILFLRKSKGSTKFVIAGGIPLMLFWGVAFTFTNKELGLYINFGRLFRPIEVICLIWFVLIFSLILFRRFNYLQKENAQQALDNERLAKEKEIERSQLIEQQKMELEKTVEERTAELKQSLQELKSTQAQLIQTEKMASLGELTAGIAHEIQNPLNFVNNFSEVSTELVDELKGERSKVNGERDEELELEILNDLSQNLVKINHHGKRADAIVKGMLQHSRTNTGRKEPTDINALTDEYLRLSYHGLRAKDKDFNADFKTDFDESIGKIEVVPQDIGRVLLNLYNNAFQAVAEKKKAASLKGENYEPTVWVTTKRISLPSGAGGLEISVKDNGTGIPDKVVDKIFQPFFTTKPTGQGTGLGLSLSYDIVKAHRGEIKVRSKEGEGAEFIIELPI